MKTSAAGKIQETELYSQLKGNTIYSKILTDQELIRMKSASRQPCPLDTKYLLYRLEVGVQVQQMRKRPTINMEGLMLVTLMVKVGPGLTKSTRSNQQTKNLNWTLKTSAAGKIQETELYTIQPIEGKHDLLKDTYYSRTDAYEKCLKAALSFGYKVFAIQAGGWCASATDAEETYNKYGGSNACHADGEGGPWANQVYKIEFHGEIIGRNPIYNFLIFVYFYE